ncbi:substrate-binding periplasmic protein [Granulosicoccus sp. 3-233]|uniref:substrate-binding periplasmic protein n=1 Tax=Granulosicoccus sp. 3-233 TaxID=3417969 RepID=UPI003D338D44
MMTPAGDGYLDRILVTLFARSGIAFELVISPPPRGVADADSGVIDAVVAPFPDMREDFPDLLPLPESLLPTNIAGLYTREEISIRSVEDFFDYRLGFLQGWSKPEELFRDHPHVTRLRTPRLLMQMLANDRVDVVYFPSAPGRYIASEIGLQGLKVSEFHLDRHLYLHFNKRHAELVLRLQEELVAMKEDGTMATILRGYETEHQLPPARAQ